MKNAIACLVIATLMSCNKKDSELIGKDVHKVLTIKNYYVNGRLVTMPAMARLHRHLLKRSRPL